MMSDYMTDWRLQIEIYKRDKQRKFRLYKIRRLLGLNIDIRPFRSPRQHIRLRRRIDIINRLFNRALYIESSDCLNYIKSTNDYKNV